MRTLTVTCVFVFMCVILISEASIRWSDAPCDSAAASSRIYVTLVHFNRHTITSRWSTHTHTAQQFRLTQIAEQPERISSLVFSVSICSFLWARHDESELIVIRMQKNTNHCGWIRMFQWARSACFVCWRRSCTKVSRQGPRCALFQLTGSTCTPASSSPDALLRTSRLETPSAQMLLPGCLSPTCCVNSTSRLRDLRLSSWPPVFSPLCCAFAAPLRPPARPPTNNTPFPGWQKLSAERPRACVLQLEATNSSYCTICLPANCKAACPGCSANTGRDYWGQAAGGWNQWAKEGVQIEQLENDQEQLKKCVCTCCVPVMVCVCVCS